MTDEGSKINEMPEQGPGSGHIPEISGGVSPPLGRVVPDTGFKVERPALWPNPPGELFEKLVEYLHHNLISGEGMGNREYVSGVIEQFSYHWHKGRLRAEFHNRPLTKCRHTT